MPNALVLPGGKSQLPGDGPGFRSPGAVGGVSLTAEAALCELSPPLVTSV